MSICFYCRITCHWSQCTSNCPQSAKMKAAAAGVIVTDGMMAASKQHLIRFWGSWVCCRPDQTRMFHKFCMSLLTAKKKKRCSALSWLCINTRVSLGYKCRSFAVAAAVCSRLPPPPWLGSTVCSPVVYLRFATVLKHHVFRCKTWCYLLEVSGEVRVEEGKGGLGLAQHTLGKYIQTFNLIIIIRLNH